MVSWWNGGLFCPVSSVDDDTIDLPTDADANTNHSHIVILDSRLFDLRKAIETLRQQVSEWQLESPLDQCRFSPRKVDVSLADDATAPTVASTVASPSAKSTTSTSVERELPVPQVEKEEENPFLPTDILVDFVAPFIADRLTYNAFALMNQEIYRACFTRPRCEDEPSSEASTRKKQAAHMLPPWPTVRLSLGARLWSLAFSPNQQLLAIGGTNGRITLIDRYHGPGQQLTAHWGRIYSIEFTPDGNTMVTLSGDGEVCVWDMNPSPSSLPLDQQDDSDHDDGDSTSSSTPNNISFCRKMPEVILKHQISTNATHSLSLALDPNQSQWAVGGASDIRWYTYPPPQGKDVWTLDMAQGCMVESTIFSPDGLSIAAGTSYNCAFIWDVATREMIHMLPVPGGIHSIAFSPDGKYLVVASDNNMLIIFQLRGNYIGMAGGLKGHTDLVWSVVWEGEWIVSASDDGTVRIWSGKTFDCLRILPRRRASLYGVALDATSDTVASVGEDGLVEIWNMKSVVSPL